MKSKILRLLAVGLLVGPTVAQAGLIAGDEVTLTFSPNDPPRTATVGPGVDLQIFNFQFDFNSGPNGDIFSWVSLPDAGSLGGNTSITLSGLAFDNFATLIGFDLQQTSLSNVSIATTANSLTIGFLDTGFVEDPGTILIGQYITAPSVPEPGTLALLGLGLLGLGLARRKAA